MMETITDRLSFLCSIVPSKLLEIDEKIFSEKPGPETWSMKEIIGHLIDSATNNHQRFVRVQFEDSPQIFYDQDKWNHYSYYNEMDRTQIIDFWRLYNLQLIELIRHIPREHMEKTCRSANGEKLSLSYLISDYVVHLEHHLKQVISY